MRLRLLALTSLAAIALVLTGACSSGNDCSGCKDIEIRIPWGTGDAHTYKLQVDGKDRGRTTLTATQKGDQVVLTSKSTDDAGNIDESIVTADATTLKPFFNDPGADNPVTNSHTVGDDKDTRIVRSIYESGAGDCDTKQVVKVEQLEYGTDDVKTAAAANLTPTPDSTRGSPLCVPEHAYDNDESLFLWRALTFEKGYHVVYKTVLANRRDTQIIELTVHDKVDKTPLGDGEAWEVRLMADQINQRAWFSTDDSHKMLAYQNGGYLFLLDDTPGG